MRPSGVLKPSLTIEARERLGREARQVFIDAIPEKDRRKYGKRTWLAGPWGLLPEFDKEAWRVVAEEMYIKGTFHE